MLYGEGSNGKSIFLYLLQALIGSSNISNESLQHLEEDKFSVANLYGKFVNVHADLKNSIMAHDAVFKAITGGDILRGERKFQHSFEFRNTTKLIFSANTRNIPVISKDDFAFFRRWILIEFANQFLEAGEKEGAKPEDKNLREKITTEEELSGFLNLALEALKTVMQNQKFSYNKSISEVTKIYKLNSSSVSAFVDACIVASEEDTENINLYKNYEAWAGAKGVKVEALNTFSKILKKMGHTNYRHSEYMSGKKTNYWENIKVDEGQLLFEMTGKQPTEKQLSEIKAKKEPAPEMFGVDYLSA
jgi:putative DNA primase/helicase